MLFNFLSCVTFSFEGFGLASVTKAELKPTLYQVQVNAVNFWMDKLRNLGADQCQTVLRSLPTSWYLPSIVRTEWV